MTKAEFEYEANSSYGIKKYGYNYKHMVELKEENLRKTYANILIRR